MDEELQQAQGQDQEQASASLSAGFNKVRGGDEQPTPEPTTTPQPEATPEPTPTPQPEPEEELFEGMPKSRAKELLSKVPDQEKSIRTLAGKVGELVRTLKQNQGASTEAPAAPARRADAPKLERTGSEYPELAESLAEDLAALLTPNHDPKQVEELVQTRLAEELEKRDQKMAARELKRSHNDWETVVVSPDFKLWLQGRPDTEQEEFASTWDPDVVGGYLTQFKTHRDSLKQQRQRSTARLEGAVTPKGDGGAATSKLPDSAGLAVGFNRVRRLHP